MSASFSCFVTGTDTEIGKTLISGSLLHALTLQGVRAVGMKPVAAGAEWREGAWHNEDADLLIEAGNHAAPQELTTPYLLREPIAPHVAAADEGVTIDLDHICACHARLQTAADAVVVEGVGGFRVPLNDRYDTADLAQRLGLPVIMVVGMRLGCLNHALLTAEAILARGLQLAGWVANVVDAGMPRCDASVEALRARLPSPLLGVVPRLQVAPGTGLPAAAAAHLDFSVLPGWPQAIPASPVSLM